VRPQRLDDVLSCRLPERDLVVLNRVVGRAVDEGGERAVCEPVATVVESGDLPSEALGHPLFRRVVLAGGGHLVDDGVAVSRQAVRLCRSVFVVSLVRLLVAPETRHGRPDRLDRVLSHRRPEPGSRLGFDLVGAGVDDFSDLVVSESLAVRTDRGDTLGEVSRRRRALVRHRLVDDRGEVDVLVVLRRGPRQFAAEVTVAEVVDDLARGLLADPRELLLEEPRHRVRLRRREHLAQGAEFDAVWVGANLLGRFGQLVCRPFVLHRLVEAGFAEFNSRVGVDDRSVADVVV